jgi:hypothetical protein
MRRTAMTTTMSEIRLTLKKVSMDEALGGASSWAMQLRADRSARRWLIIGSPEERVTGAALAALIGGEWFQVQLPRGGARKGSGAKGGTTAGEILPVVEEILSGRDDMSAARVVEELAARGLTASRSTAWKAMCAARSRGGQNA